MPAAMRAVMKSAVSCELLMPMSPYAKTVSGYAVAASPTARGAVKGTGADAPQRGSTTL